MPQFCTSKQILELSIRRVPSRVDLRQLPPFTMADLTPKDTAPIVVPELKTAGDGSRKISTIKPSLLGYLKEISGGYMRMSDEQLLEIKKDGPVNNEDKVNKVELNVLLDYMTRKDSNAMTPLKESDLDLSYPLSSYFISSSHNTYLSGNQVYGDASAEVYKDVRG